MSYDEKVKKTMPSKREADILLDSQVAANLQEASIAKIPKVPFTKIMIMLVVAKAIKEYSNSHYRIGGATTRLLGYFRELASMYYINGEYYEKRALELNDPSMILDLGYRYYDPRVAYAKPPIEARNTTTIGVLLIIVKKVFGSRYYNIESTISGSDIVAKKDTVGNTKGENKDGFISGELYLIRAQPVSKSGEEGEWTPYFTIRAK